MNKDLALSIITGTIPDPSESNALDHLHNTLSNCANLGSLNVWGPKKPFALSFDAKSDHKFFFYFFIS